MQRFVLWIVVAAVSSTLSFSVCAQFNFNGVVYAKTSFPGHPIDPILKRIDFESGGINSQYSRIRDSIGLNSQTVEDPMYMAGIFLMPAYSVLTVSDNEMISTQYSSGYVMEARLNKQSDTAWVLLQAHDAGSPVFADMKVGDVDKVWERFEVDPEEYSVKTLPGTVMIAGYKCDKTVYVFKGTTRKPALSTRVISRIPWKLTLYSAPLDPSLNLQAPYRIHSSKAFLRMDVELDQAGKNKMIWEVTRIEKQIPESIRFYTIDGSPNMHYPQDQQEIGSGIILHMGTALQTM